MNPGDRTDQAGELRVLYVEDDEDCYVLLRELLAEVAPELRLEWSSSYACGLARAQRAEHDAYVFDYRLDARTGLDLARELRRSGAGTPFVLVSGNVDADLREQALASGAIEVLPKDAWIGPALADSVRRAVCGVPAPTG